VKSSEFGIRSQKLKLNKDELGSVRRVAIRLLLFCMLFFTVFSFGSTLQRCLELATPNPETSLAFLVSRPLSFVNEALAVEVPPLKGYVNDYANMISPAIRTKLTNELKEFERTDSTQIVILTIPSLEGQTIEDYSIKVAETWKIGQKGRDNGIIFMVANKERKIRIEIGRGLEGRLTDLTAGRIIDLVVKPRFKRGDFNGGFVAGVAALIDATKGEFKADDRNQSKTKKSFPPFFTILLFGGVGLLILGSISRALGGIAGGIGLPIAGYFALGSSMLTLVLLVVR